MYIALSDFNFFLSASISLLTIAGGGLSSGCKIINTARDFPQLDFTVPNDTTFWLWDDIMEQKYWKGLSEWKRKPLKDLNLSLFQPKKDRCDTCCSYEVGNVTEEDWKKHQDEKNAARSEKEKDKHESSCDTLVICMDLQAVLLSPCLNASALYYKTKLKVHNFTIFDLKTKDGFCFLWDESEGGVTANEFATIIVDFILQQDRVKVKRVVIFSDGCTYQNRNSILANALSLASVQTGFEIEQKYLCKGHTQMEADSMHSKIEHAIKNKPVYSPLDYVYAARFARNIPKPYHVRHLSHDFFKKYSDLHFLKSIRPGNKIGDPVVTDIRCLKYTPDGKVYYKLSFSEDYSILNRGRNPGYPKLDTTVAALYEGKLPIKTSKYGHLQELKSVIPKEYHSFYDNLPHN